MVGASVERRNKVNKLCNRMETKQQEEKRIPKIT